MNGSASIEFVPLTAVPLDAVTAVLNEPRNARHMPLSREFTAADTREWVRAKDAQWEQHGFGPWAVMVDGVFAGWGGFQREDVGPDFALVLRPKFWGSGAAIAMRALERGFKEFGFAEVCVTLPFSRRPTRALARWGFVPGQDVVLEGVCFRVFRLTRVAWARTTQRWRLGYE